MVGESRKTAPLLVGGMTAALVLTVVLEGRLGAFPGVPASAEAQRCAKAIGKATRAVLKTRLATCAACERSQAADGTDENVECSTADAGGKVARVLAKSDQRIASACSDAAVAELSLGACGPTAGALQACLRTGTDAQAQALCRAMHGTSPLGSAQRDEAKCQSGLAGRVARYADAVLKEERRCLAGVMRDGGSPGGCNASLPRRATAEAGIGGVCTDSLVATLVVCDPPSADLAAAVARTLDEAECRASAALAATYGLAPPDCTGICAVPASTTTTSTATTTTTSPTTVPTSTSTTPSTSTTSTTLQQAPHAVARPSSQTVLVGTTVVLDGTGSLDLQEDPLSFQWTLVSSPGGSSASLQDATAPTPSFMADVAGAYVVRLVVTAAGQPSDPADATVTAVATSPLALAITEPANGAVVTGSAVRVRGSVAGPDNTGVVVNGVVADVRGGVFVAEIVPLVVGTNALVALGTSPAGETLGTSVAVTRQSGSPSLSLRALRRSAVVPTTVRFTYEFASTVRIYSLAMDFDGDGSDDFFTLDPSAPLAFLYDTPGVYAARLTLEDWNGDVHQADATVVVHSLAEMEAIFQGIWSGINTALVAGDVDAALAFVSEISRPRFGAAWQALLPHMPEIIGSYSPLQPWDITPRIADYFITRVLDGETRIFFVAFRRDADGVWRLNGM